MTLTLVPPLKKLEPLCCFCCRTKDEGKGLVVGGGAPYYVCYECACEAVKIIEKGRRK